MPEAPSPSDFPAAAQVARRASSSAPEGPASASALVLGAYDEQRLASACEGLRTELGGNPTLAVVFFSPDYAERAGDWLDVVRLHGRVTQVVGSSGQGLIASGYEAEDQSGISLLFLRLPGTKTHVFSFNADDVEAAQSPSDWHTRAGLAPDRAAGWLVFADPFDEKFSATQWLSQWNAAYPGVATIGGFSGGAQGFGRSWRVMDGKLVEGAVAVGFEGPIELRGVVSQGCQPIGEPLTITGAAQNILITLGSQPAYQVLREAYRRQRRQEAAARSAKLGEPDHKEDAAAETAGPGNARGHLFAGLAKREQVEDFAQGDFFVHTILGADPDSGAVAITGEPRVGQTAQYHLLEAATATEELHRLLKREADYAAMTPPLAGILCSCNGRGTHLFPTKHHDARAIEHAFEQLPLAGFFANGEIGPVGGRNSLHGFTASLGLFYPKREPAALLSDRTG